MLADSGFNVIDHFALEGVRLIVPAYTKKTVKLSQNNTIEVYFQRENPLWEGNCRLKNF